MNLIDILNRNKKPPLYEKGNMVMWTDPHISKQLLQIHLNPELDLASRKYSTIKSTADWILNKIPNKKLNILDLGCGPGLYSEIFAKKGHQVTGIDFSQTSIDYAKQEACKKNLDIAYDVQNYLNLELDENQFDLVTLVYCDLGPLLPQEREQLLTNINKVLKPGGIFIFDILNDKNLEKKVSPKNWECVKNGFWKEKPYLALSNSILYKENKVVLNQHIIVDEDDNTEIYRFWTHFFSHKDLIEILLPFGFTNMSFHEDVLPGNDIWNGDNVTFCKAVLKEE